jgi:hypothetical protein
MKWGRRVLAGLLGSLLSSSLAHAAEEPAKRAEPDYDGRGGPKQTPGQKALWIPRILLSPLYFVSEFVIRRPLGFAITAAEKANLPSELYDFFAFGPDHKAGIVPIAFVDFGFEPSVGLYGFWDDAGFKGHQLRLHGSTWGAHWLSGTATERFVFDERFELTLTGTATRRPDYAFYGIGPDTRESALSRYASDSVDTRVQTRLTFGGSNLLETSFGYRGVSYGHSNYDEANRNRSRYQPSVEEAAARGDYALPPGFSRGYRSPQAHTRLVLDTRGKATTASGARLEVLAAPGVDLKNAGTSWVRYGGTAGAFWDIDDSGRVVSLSVSTLFSDPLGDQPVPFTELVTLGGPGSIMPGFRAGRLYGRSAAVAALRYSWPVWVWLNGSLQVATGNVFDEHLEGFRAGRGRLSTALGLEGVGSRDSIFQLLVGFGTETFESGTRIDSLRVSVGARSGF